MEGGDGIQLKYHIVTIEDLVPAEHFLRKLEAALDSSFVYEETAHLYSRRYGRPPIDPMVIVKYFLVGYLYGIPSERQIEQRYADSNAARYDLNNHFNIIFSVTVLSVFDSARFSPAETPEPGRYLPRQTPPSGFFPGKSAVPKCAVPAHPAC